MQDRSSEVLDATRILMRKGQQEEACRLLAEARDRAASEGRLDEAALYSSVRGSYLAAMGRDEEAQESYRNAEHFSGGEVLDKLITARHLIYGMGKPEDGLKKLEEVLIATPEGTTQHQEALAIQGLARLALNQPDEAMKSLRSLVSSFRPNGSSGSDLILVEEFIKKHEASELCRTYLALAESRAQGTQDRATLAHILAIKKTL